MKRLIALIIAIVMVFSLTSCGPANTESKAQSGSAAGDGKINTSASIKESDTKVEDGLDLNGKTVTYAIGVQLTDGMKRQIIAFEKKYGCTVETEYLGFTDYVQLLGSKIAAGNHYDIIQVEGVRFPNIAIANFCEPLEDVISTADIGTAKEKSKGGFDEELTNAFKWNGHLYAVVGVAGEFSPQMMVMYYNKKYVKEAGAEDPRELYEKGEWDFDAFYRVGTQIRQALKGKDVYMCDTQTLNRAGYWNGAQAVDESDRANPKSNITNSAQINAFKFAQQCAVGANAISWFGDGGASKFIEGKLAMFSGFHFDLYQNEEIGKNVEASNAFGKKLDNLGMVPCPMGPDNTDGKQMVGSWLYGIGAGTGTSDPRIAMAFAKFSTTYKQINTTKYKWSDDDQALIDTITDGPKIWNNGSYADGTNYVYLEYAKACYTIMQGDDISQAVTKYDKTIQNCIDVAIAQQ
ncbi:MAG: extracellular solute-binding protein [Clostridia bacterium]|nr:extracellular solute-binding protein [Clostridia bacterium]